MDKKTKNKLMKILLVLIIMVCTYFYEEYFQEDTTKNEVEYRQNQEVKINPNNLVIHFVDVGQGDCILIGQNNEYVLIDAGNNEDGQLLVEYFKELGVKKFKYVIGTHAHEDHIGGIDNIINNFELDKFYMPDVITTTKTFEDVLDALLKKQKAFDTPKIGDKFKLNDLFIFTYIFMILYLIFNNQGREAKKINKLMFETKSKSSLRLEMIARETLEYHFDGKCAIITVTQDMYKKSGSNEHECYPITALPRQIEGVLVGAVIKEKKDGSFGISVRTEDGIDAAEICARLGGGGHKGAAGSSFRETYEEGKKKLLDSIKISLDGISK